MPGGQHNLSAESDGRRCVAAGQPGVEQAEGDADAAGDGRYVPVGSPLGGTLSSTSAA